MAMPALYVLAAAVLIGEAAVFFYLVFRSYK
jgi:hypothetical protein